MNEKKNFQSIDEYIAVFPEAIQEILQIIRQTIAEAAPDSEEAISYQMPTFKLKGINLVHFAAFKQHIGFYPVPSGLDLISRIVKFRVEETLKKAEAKTKKVK